MAKLKIGDVVLTPMGYKWEVIGIWVDGNAKTHYWVFDGNRPYGANDEIEGWEVKLPFFEEGRNYESRTTGTVVTIWHVHKLAKGEVAVAQTSTGEPYLLQEHHRKAYMLK